MVSGVSSEPCGFEASEWQIVNIVVEAKSRRSEENRRSEDNRDGWQNHGAGPFRTDRYLWPGGGMPVLVSRSSGEHQGSSGRGADGVGVACDLAFTS
jgi:hypothetical protein